MNSNEILGMLQRHGVKPTANRIIIAGALAQASNPLSLSDLEVDIATIDKSSIFRTLATFKEHGLVHVIEDGSDSAKYELCHGTGDEHDSDRHVHFYCERCNRTFCLSQVHVPQVQLPAGYQVRGVNYLVKGLCPHCAAQAAMQQD
jgi:ferric uptake regulation protein